MRIFQQIVLLCIFSISTIVPTKADERANVIRNHEALRSLLSVWIGSQIHFFTKANGAPSLFVRRAPVRGKVYSEIAGLEQNLQRKIELFSSAAGLSYKPTNVNPNIMAVVGSPINSGDSPNRAFLRHLGLPEQFIDIVARSTGWSNGCGIYSFTGNVAAGMDGQVILSLALADARLPVDKIEDCMTEGIIRAFGVRINARTVIHERDGYFQYLQLVSALKTCDRQINFSTKRQVSLTALKALYVACASEQLMATMRFQPVKVER